jgi:hypothetical protein
MPREKRERSTRYNRWEGMPAAFTQTRTVTKRPILIELATYRGRFSEGLATLNKGELILFVPSILVRFCELDMPNRKPGQSHPALSSR